MVHLKSKIKKIVDPAADFSAYPEFRFNVWHMTNSGYIAEFEYFYMDEDDQKRPINYLSNRREVSFEQADAIAATITRDPNLSYSDEEKRFLTFGSLALISADKPFNLSAGDWEIITESND